MLLGEGQLLLLVGAVAVLRRRRAARRRRFSYVLASMFGRKDYNSIPRLDLWGNFLEPCRPLGFDDKFREKMRCTPATFDALVERLKQTDVYRRRMQRTGRGLDVLLQRRPWSASTCSLARSRTRGLRLPATSVGKATSARLYRVVRGIHGHVADVAPRRSNASSLLCASSRTKRFVFPRTQTAPRSTRASKPDVAAKLKPHAASRPALAR